jgi:large subunit ribosomal protein L18
MNKKQSRLRRARQTRIRIAQKSINRLAVHRSNQHMYAQVYSTCGTKVLASASTVDAEVKVALAGVSGGNKAAAIIVGKFIAQRAVAAGVEFVAFDRSGNRFHGRVKALADSVIENGLKISAPVKKEAAVAT